MNYFAQIIVIKAIFVNATTIGRHTFPTVYNLRGKFNLLKTRRLTRLAKKWLEYGLFLALSWPI